MTCSDCLDPVCRTCAAAADPVLCPECHFFYSHEDLDEIDDDLEEGEEM